MSPGHENVRDFFYWKVFLLFFNHLQKTYPYKSKIEF